MDIDQKEKNIDLKTPKNKKSPKEKPKKLRALVKPKSISKIDETKENPKNSKKFYVFTLLALAAAFIYSNISISRCGFWATYEHNFNKIVYGDENFCYRSIDTTETFEQLTRQVVGQDDALRLIKGSLSLANREKMIQIAFYGSTGTGKTFSANIISQNFKWQRNIISTIFDINFQVNLTGQEAFDSDLKEVETKFSDCGFNLLVIDDVDVKPATIQRINELERSLQRMVKQKLFKLVIIVIFNGELETELLKNFVTIEFARFTEETFHKCIEIHQTLRNIKLKPSEVEELKMINFTSSGCKTVAKKINLMASL